ncbi:MAG: hypothetical protein KM310_06955 [Clostridiales bacterium]|nr:hypothetical protein [Clostridiales bacterium]
MITIQRHVYGRKPNWIARIDGRDKTYGLSRRFIHRRDVTRHRTNVYREYEWVVDLTEGVIYEYCFAISSGQEERGFWRVKGGQLVEVSYQEVLEAFPQEGGHGPA